MESRANLGYRARPYPQHNELGFTQGHVLHTATPTWSGQGKKNHRRIFTTAMDSSQHPWHHQGRLIKATRTQLSGYSSLGSRGTKEGILPVSSAESHSCQATVAGRDPTGRSPEKRFGNKLATQPPCLPPLLPNRVSLSPPPGPFVLLSSKHLFTI